MSKRKMSFQEAEGRLLRHGFIWKRYAGVQYLKAPVRNIGLKLWAAIDCLRNYHNCRVEV